MNQKDTSWIFYISLGLVLIVIGLVVWALGGGANKEKLQSLQKISKLEKTSTKPLPSISRNKQTEQNSEESSPISQGQVQDEKTIKVSKIIDGDTIKLENGQVVRYIGIDAPESKSCFANESTTKNSEIVLGKEITMEKDLSETDKYGRILRYVYVGDTFINELLVREGFAKAYPYPPDVKYRQTFEVAEQEAQSNNKGLWGECSQQQVAQRKPPIQRSQAIEGDKDCSDFKTQSEAQTFFLSQGGPEKDSHRLDQDRDGIACESLPK